MKNNNNNTHEVENAKAADKNHTLLAWTMDYLQSHQRNQVVIEDIQKRKITKILFIEYPLNLLERPTGPLNGETEPEPLPIWVKRVAAIQEGIDNKDLPPPIIVTDFWQKLYIVDGNHRHEALLKSGFQSYWTIFLLEDPHSEEKVLAGLNKTPGKITTIMVDVGGVLVREIDTDARKIWLKKFFITPRELTKEVYRTGKAKLATIGKVAPAEIWQDIKHKYDLTAKEAAQLEQDFHAGDRLNTELFTYIQHLHQQYKTAILSNAWLNSREIYTQKYHLDTIVDQMIISAEIGMRKPNKNIFKLALQLINTPAENVVYIDDRPDNIKTAKAMGINTVLFTNTAETIEKINSFLHPQKL